MEDSLEGQPGKLSQWVKIRVNIFAKMKLIFAVYPLVIVGCVCHFESGVMVFEVAQTYDSCKMIMFFRGLGGAQLITDQS